MLSRQLGSLRTAIDDRALLVERSVKSAEKAADNAADSKSASDVVGGYMRELRYRAAQIV